jgi:hypothetical protein
MRQSCKLDNTERYRSGAFRRNLMTGDCEMKIVATLTFDTYSFEAYKESMEELTEILSKLNKSNKDFTFELKANEKRSSY